ncbi:hypothetical protein ANOM_003537 [Aspergillus nomiae NRRL 13137]|uniref:Uncharacterized protein n=1 Tax=Aspergillus nomiae NRRL (strain ATCC 15546 / NRRL 13137 / CBS 260.88 / M93) TaxID=1509407 RepID=A0A0L1J9W6_ASPN3|nr:uncharacterized protein ANOM_003537 [Aspergillus nomiae NRRL 13137]KNG88586.1 hypothetical protein ANOM_003537 [Aspergillus nomiae NRRL 13137]
MDSPQYQELGLVSQEQQPTDHENVRATWKFLAGLSSNLTLVGFLVMPLAFEDAKDDSRGDKTGTAVAALALIGNAYLLSLILIGAQYRKRTYLIHSVFLPCLFSNLLGLLNVVLHIFCRKLLPIGRLATVGMVLASIFAVVYALCALWAYGRSIADDIRVDESDRTMIPLTEEEMQRQQLLRLLQENQDKKRSSSKVMQKTFRVKVPEHINPGKGWDSFMPPPRENNYYS